MLFVHKTFCATGRNVVGFAETHGFLLWYPQYILLLITDLCLSKTVVKDNKSFIHTQHVLFCFPLGCYAIPWCRDDGKNNCGCERRRSASMSSRLRINEHKD